MKPKIVIIILIILCIIFIGLTIYYRNQYTNLKKNYVNGAENIYQVLKKQEDAGIRIEEVEEDGKSWYVVHFKNYYLDSKDDVITVHDSVENFEKDYEVLRKCGIENKVIVPEVSEENYETRADQIEEIKMLLKIHQ